MGDLNFYCLVEGVEVFPRKYSLEWRGPKQNKLMAFANCPNCGRNMARTVSKNFVQNGGKVNPVTAIANSVTAVVSSLAPIIEAARAARDKRKEEHLLKVAELRERRVHEMVVHYDYWGSRGKIYEKGWSPYLYGGPNQYKTGQEAYDKEGIVGMLPYIEMIVEWQLPEHGALKPKGARP